MKRYFTSMDAFVITSMDAFVQLSGVQIFKLLRSDLPQGIKNLYGNTENV